MINRVTIFLIFFLSLIGKVYGQELSYQSLVQKAQETNPKTDFQKIRLFYTKTSDYNPYPLDFEKKKSFKASL